MKIHVITACHNRIETTKKLIKSLKEQTVKNIHLILVDDGSTDGTAEYVRQEFKDSTIISGDGNLWWGGALHQAYKWIVENKIPNNEVVFFTNDDNIYTQDYLKKAFSHLKENPHSLIAGNGFNMVTGEQCDGVSYCDLKTGDIELLGTESVGNLASTRALMMRIGTLKKIGGFHPFLLPHYLSDYEFVLRAAKKGYQIMTFADLTYDYDRSQTGIKDLEKLTIKKLFSKKCPYNPIYKFNYIFMVTPIQYLPYRIVTQIGNYIKLLAHR